MAKRTPRPCSVGPCQELIAWMGLLAIDQHIVQSPERYRADMVQTDCKRLWLKFEKAQDCFHLLCLHEHCIQMITNVGFSRNLQTEHDLSTSTLHKAWSQDDKSVQARSGLQVGQQLGADGGRRIFQLRPHLPYCPHCVNQWSLRLMLQEADTCGESGCQDCKINESEWTLCDINELIAPLRNILQ